MPAQGVTACGKTSKRNSNSSNGKLHWGNVRRGVWRSVQRAAGVLSQGAETPAFATACGTDDGAKLRWSDVSDTGAALWQAPGVRIVVLVCALALVCGTGVVGGGSSLVALCVLAGAWATLVQCPAFSTVHVFVDNSNVAIPLLSRGRRINYAMLRTHLLKDPAPPLVWQAVASYLRTAGYDAAADAVVTRVPGTMYVCGSGRAGRREAPWCGQAREADFQVTLLARVDRGVGYCGEQNVDDDLHKHMGNATMDTAGGNLTSFLVVLGRTLGVIPRSVMVQVSGDGNANGLRGGFPSQLRRALRYGMHVEVAAWRECMSAQYPALVQEHSKWSSVHMRLRYLNDAEDDITVPAPACREGGACTSQRCTFAHPAPEPSNSVDSETSPASKTSEVKYDTATADTSTQFPTADSAAAPLPVLALPVAEAPSRPGPRSPTPATRVCAGPPDDGTTWSRGARRARSCSTSSSDSARSSGSGRKQQGPAAPAASVRRTTPPPSSGVARAPPGLCFSRTSDSTPKPLGRWSRLSSAPGSMSRPSHSAPTGSCTFATAVDELTRFQAPCRYGARCTLRKCGFTHPAGWVRQPLLPTDRVVRSRDNDAPRPWAARDRRAPSPAATRHELGDGERCSWDREAPSTVAPIPDFRRSTSTGSSHRRPTGFRGVDCRYGMRCTSADCGFTHPPEWTRPQYQPTGASAAPRGNLLGHRTVSPPRSTSPLRTSSPPRAACQWRQSSGCRAGATLLAPRYSLTGYGTGQHSHLTMGSRSPSVH